MSFDELIASLTTQEWVVVTGLIFFALFFLGLVIRSWLLTQILNERAAKTAALSRLERAKPDMVRAKRARRAIRKAIPAVRSAVPAPRKHRYNGLKGRG